VRKIPTLFVRDFAARPAHVTSQVTPGCEWVLAGEGKATRKWDGVCLMLDQDGEWWARREVKPGKTAPEHFVEVQHDDETDKVVGWEPISQTGWAKLHAEALANTGFAMPGTYELLGPRVNGNPDDYAAHMLMPHGWAPLSVRIDVEKAPRDFNGLREWLHAHPQYEGIVWHHNDGRMAKLKRRDFPRPEAT
jgi:hypothetical protein